MEREGEKERCKGNEKEREGGISVPLAVATAGMFASSFRD